MNEVREEPEEVDRTMLSIKDIADNIDIVLSDERFKKSDKDKFEDFKNWILSIVL